MAVNIRPSAVRTYASCVASRTSVTTWPSIETRSFWCPSGLLEPETQLPPGCERRRDWLKDVAILDLCVGQGQDAVVRIGKTGCVCSISDLQGFTEFGFNPQALGAVLQHDGRAGLVIGDRSLHVNPWG